MVKLHRAHAFCSRIQALQRRYGACMVHAKSEMACARIMKCHSTRLQFQYPLKRRKNTCLQLKASACVKLRRSAVCEPAPVLLHPATAAARAGNPARSSVVNRYGHAVRGTVIVFHHAVRIRLPWSR